MIKKYLSYVTSLLLIVGCESVNLTQDVEPLTPTTTGDYENKAGAIAGTLSILVTEELGEKLENMAVTKSSIGNVMDCEELAALGVNSVERVFPYAGKFEERTRKSGLHLWYTVKFDKSIANTRVAGVFSGVDGIRIVEDQIAPTPPEGELVVASPYFSFTTKLADNVFDDPRLGDQWHYINNGEVEGFRAGIDINIEPLWRSGVSGSSDILIAVVDGGIDITHPDLQANVYVNQAEANGVAGVDDDNNGYVDDINGYNFVSMTNEILAYDHGTHVAGTVAAVNNNGIGVCGVAGGDGTADSGVKLISCQIFQHSDTGDLAGDETTAASAIKYGCDAGAIICQNSWGYTVSDLQQLDLDAIDYFREWGGKDENGNQVGLVNGGVVVFAAGNDAVTYSNPGQYEVVLNVTALAPDGHKPAYSNYGEWADISAPGGDKDNWEAYVGGVLSTIPEGKYEADYGYYTGTSMACPHVSGIIALYIQRMAELGKTEGLTPEMIFERITSTTRSIQEYEPEYYSMMGSGLVDASRFVGIESDTEPSPVTDLSCEEMLYTSLSLRWSMPENAKGFKLFYSEKSLEGVDFNAYGDDVMVKDINQQVESDGTILARITGLMPQTKYYVAVQSWDYNDKYSDVSAEISATTAQNKNPMFYLESGEQADSYSTTIARTEVKKLLFNIADPDGDAIIYSYVQGGNAETALYTESKQLITLFLNGANDDEGEYSIKFIAQDKYGGESEFIVNYTIQSNVFPTLVSEFEDIVMDMVGRKTILELEGYFEDSDSDEPMTYSVSSDNESVVTAICKEERVTLTSTGYGFANITVTATDVFGGSAQGLFKVTCGNNDNYTVSAYPNPVSKTLNIKTEAIAIDKVSLYNSRGVEVLTQEDMELRTVDVSALASGVYSVDVVVDGKSNILNITKL